MQFTTLIISALAATAFAYPTDKPGNGGGGGDGGSNYKACGNNGVLYSSPQCCATDVLGAADLDCANRKSLLLSSYASSKIDWLTRYSSLTPATKVPTSASDFQAVCAAVGQRPRCCVLPVVSYSGFIPCFSGKIGS